MRRHAGGPSRSPGPPEPARRPVLLRSAVLAGVLGAAAVVAFVAPGLLVTRVFDDAALARGVGQVLVTDYALDATSVRCPSGVRVEAGATFTCAATVAGREVVVPVRIVSRSGAYEVGRPA